MTKLLSKCGANTWYVDVWFQIHHLLTLCKDQARALLLDVMQTAGPGPSVLTVPLVATASVGEDMGELKG